MSNNLKADAEATRDFIHLRQRNSFEWHHTWSSAAVGNFRDRWLARGETKADIDMALIEVGLIDDRCMVPLKTLRAWAKYTPSPLAACSGPDNLRARAEARRTGKLFVPERPLPE
jgi:hypothetical protein